MSEIDEEIIKGSSKRVERVPLWVVELRNDFENVERQLFDLKGAFAEMQGHVHGPHIMGVRAFWRGAEVELELKGVSAGIVLVHLPEGVYRGGEALSELERLKDKLFTDFDHEVEGNIVDATIAFMDRLHETIDAFGKRLDEAQPG